VPALPVAISLMMLVVHLADIQAGEELDFSVAVMTPGGLVSVPTAVRTVWWSSWSAITYT
jgi:hypothetical protein